MMGKSMLLCGDNRCSTERPGEEGMKGFCKERGEEMVGRGRGRGGVDRGATEE